MHTCKQCNATQHREWSGYYSPICGCCRSKGSLESSNPVGDVQPAKSPRCGCCSFLQQNKEKKRGRRCFRLLRTQETVETERRKERSGRGDGPEPVGDLALLLVGLDEHARVAHEVRVSLAQDDPHRLGVDEADEAEHALLLVRDAHVLHRPVHAAKGGRRTGRVAVDGSIITRFGSFRSPVIGLEWNGTDWTTRRERERGRRDSCRNKNRTPNNGGAPST
jgi:hypothetical protein